MARDRFDDTADDFDDRSPNRFEEDAGEPEGDRRATDIAKSAVSTPAIMLIIHAILGLLGVVYGIVTISTSNPAEEFRKQRVVEENRPGLDANQKAATKQTYDMVEPALDAYTKALPALTGLGLVVNLLMLIGAIKMKNLSSPGFAKLACVLGIIPCFGGCCIIGIVGGFMGFSALGKPEVKSAFAIRSR